MQVQNLPTSEDSGGSNTITDTVLSGSARASFPITTTALNLGQDYINRNSVGVNLNSIAKPEIIDASAETPSSAPSDVASSDSHSLRASAAHAVGSILECQYHETLSSESSSLNSMT